MNFSRWLRKTRKTRLKIHKFGLKGLTFLNGFSLIYWVCWIDAIVSWQPYLIMAINFGWLCLMGYCNSWFFNIQEEGEYNDEMSGYY